MSTTKSKFHQNSMVTKHVHGRPKSSSLRMLCAKNEQKSYIRLVNCVVYLIYLFFVYLTTLLIAQIIRIESINRMTNACSNETERMLKKAVVA
jgi:hypothetical protein